MKILFQVFASLLLLAGCVANNIEKSYSLDPKRGTGVVTGTITYDGDYAAYRIHVAEVQTGRSYTLQHGEAQTANLVRVFKGEAINADLRVKGSAFAVELPAGEYEIKSWHISQGAANVRSTEPINTRFRVEPGQSIYLGNFHFTETARFVRSITAASLSLTEMSDRDLPVLLKTFPSLQANPIAQSLQPKTRIENVGGQSNGTIAIPVFVPMAR